jgi:hypothetical protein
MATSVWFSEFQSSQILLVPLLGKGLPEGSRVAVPLGPEWSDQFAPRADNRVSVVNHVSGRVTHILPKTTRLKGREGRHEATCTVLPVKEVHFLAVGAAVVVDIDSQEPL